MVFVEWLDEVGKSCHMMCTVAHILVFRDNEILLYWHLWLIHSYSS